MAGNMNAMDMLNSLFGAQDDAMEEATTGNLDTLHTSEPSPIYKPKNVTAERDYASLSKTEQRSRDLQEHVDFFKSPQENSQFRAQLRHESGGKFDAVESGYYKDANRLGSMFSKSRFQGKDPKTLTRNSEKLQNTIYGGVWGEKNLGNTQEGDGYLYRGRGPMQITGRANYETLGKRLGIDLVNNPDLAISKKYAIPIAAEFWKMRVKPKVRDFSNTKKVTKIINGGNIGLAERETLYGEFMSKYI